MLGWARRIVGDTRAMREEMRAARRGLSGRMRIAAIPTALAMVPRLTTPFRDKHPGVTFSVLSRTSIEVLSLLGNFDIDAGITYLDNEPLGRVLSVPLYAERYQLITAAGTPLADRATVTWAEVSRLPLCLLTPDMQNRRIIDQHLAEAGVQVRPTLESNSMIVLFSHIRTGKWSSIMPLNLAETFGFAEPIRAIPIVEPDASHVVGLVAAPREPRTPLVSALLDEAMALAGDFGRRSERYLPAMPNDRSAISDEAIAAPSSGPTGARRSRLRARRSLDVAPLSLGDVRHVHGAIARPDSDMTSDAVSASSSASILLHIEELLAPAAASA